MPLHHKVVLPTHAAEHPATFQLVRHTGAEQRHGKCAVDKASVAPLQALEAFLAVQLVDIADRGHVDGVERSARQGTQALVKVLRAEEKTTVYQHPVRLCVFVQGAGIGLALTSLIGVDLAPHDACIGQCQQAVDEHLAATVKALGERELPSLTGDE
ncbi:hypothetical protein D9M71_331730 [compost metagenome]